MWTGSQERLSCVTSTSSKNQDGFSLTEVIVAFAILSVSLAVLMQSFSLGSKSITHAQKVLEAASYAQSKLEEVGYTIELKRQEKSGEFQPLGFGWNVTIDPFDKNQMKILTLKDGTPTPDTNLFKTKISIYEQASGRLLYELETIRLKASQQ